MTEQERGPSTMSNLDGSDEVVANLRKVFPKAIARIEAGAIARREERLRLVLETITVDRYGQRMYRTRNGVPMEMPAKFDRMVRAALTPEEGQAPE